MLFIHDLEALTTIENSQWTTSKKRMHPPLGAFTFRQPRFYNNQKSLDCALTFVASVQLDPHGDTPRPGARNDAYCPRREGDQLMNDRRRVAVPCDGLKTR